MTVEILMKCGKKTIVDDQDSDLANLKWHLHPKGYAMRSEFYKYKKKGVKLHRVILSRIVGRELLRSEQVDHINHDRLDNRRGNLRIVNNTQNSMNRSRSKSKFGFKGVRDIRGTKNFSASIVVDGKHIWLGKFLSAEEAARAYDTAAIENFREYASLNFPPAPFVGYSYHRKP